MGILTSDSIFGSKGRPDSAFGSQSRRYSVSGPEPVAEPGMVSFRWVVEITIASSRRKTMKCSATYAK